MLYNQEQAKLSFEREEALRKERETLEKERLRKIEQARLKHEQWEKSSYPKLKRISVVAVMCLIIGVAGICLSTENYIAHNVNALPYSYTSYVSPPQTQPTPTPILTPTATPTPTQIPTFTPSIYSSITILNESGLTLSVQYAPYSPSVYDRQGYGGTGLLGCLNINVNISDNVGYSIFFANTTFTGSTYPNTNSLWSGVVAYNNALITLYSFIVSDTYLIVITTNIQSETPSVSYVGMAYFTLNYIPTVISPSIVQTSIPTPILTPTSTPQPTQQPTGTYVTHTTILNETYSFNQAMSKVSASAMGITEILLIVIGTLILVAIPIVVYSKSCYELEQVP